MFKYTLIALTVAATIALTVYTKNYTILVHIYLGSGQTNINYNLLNPFICRCHRTLVWQYCALDVTFCKESL